MHRVVFICTGNICRSAMAQGMAQNLLPQCKDEFISMGTGALVGASADTKAVSVCAEIGVDISTHRAQGIDIALLLKAKLIVCMEKGHRDYVSALAPQLAEKCVLLKHYPRKKGWTSGVQDPYQKSRRAFVKSRNTIYSSVQTMVKSPLFCELLEV